MAGVFAWAATACQAAQHWTGMGQRVVSWTEEAPADRVRLGVRDEGVYRVSAAEIAAAAGVSEAAVRDALNACGLALSCQGQAIAWTTEGDALYFYGEPTRELFAPENVYWLSFEPGVPMAVVGAAPEEGSATNLWFMCSASYRSSFVAPVEPRDRRSSNGTLTNMLNFGEWIKNASDATLRTKTKMIELSGFEREAATGVIARVSLASYRDFVTPDVHTCEILVNGVSAGTQSWSGEQAVTYDYAVPAGVATNGTILFTVRSAGGTTTVSDFLLLDAVVFYPRRYLAETGLVVCAGGPAQTVNVSGLTTNAVGVWDLADPAAPKVLDAPVWPDTNGTWSVTFLCGDESARYAVFGAAGGCFEPSVSGVRDTDWSAPGEMPELAIVIPPRRWVSGFAEAVQPLADFRNAQGLRTRVVDAEELYNAFSDGLVHPQAFQRFSAAGVTNGAAQTLRYLLFAGYGGSDYKLDAFKLGQDERCPTYFPLYLYAQTETVLDTPAALLLPNDLALGNAVGGAVPEVAVGRFIATNSTELTYMVNKTIRYELTEAWKNKATFSTSSYFPAQGDMDFAAVARTTSYGFETGGWRVASFYSAAATNDNRNLWFNIIGGTGIRTEFLSGSGFYYYLGHSNDLMGGPSTTKANAVISDVNLKAGAWNFAPVALMMGCRLGRWTLLNLVTGDQCLSEAGVRNRTSGFTAVISPAGYMQPGDARNFSYAFSAQVAAGAVRLGDAWLGALAALGDTTTANLQHLTFLGDPSLCIRATGTARGTPAAWLIARGLTGDPYADLSDQDLDGFATWQEYQAGTDPLLQGSVRMLALQLPSSASATGLPVSFELLSGKSYQVLSTTNLASGVWEPVPWRADENAAWSFSAILGDWPRKTVEVPYDRGATRRFYRIRSD